VRFGRWALGTPEVTSKTFSGQQVWFVEDPTRPKSRDHDAWLRHGAIGWLDGPDQIALETFLNAYFAVPFRGTEDPLLAGRMVDLPGFVFTNAVDRTKEQAAGGQMTSPELQAQADLTVGVAPIGRGATSSTPCWREPTTAAR
jgi:hypothetical protein